MSLSAVMELGAIVASEQCMGLWHSLPGRPVEYLTLRSCPNAAKVVPCRWSSWMKVPMSLMNGGRAIRPIVITPMLNHRNPWKCVLHVISSNGIGKGFTFGKPMLLETEIQRW